VANPEANPSSVAVYVKFLLFNTIKLWRAVLEVFAQSSVPFNK